MQTPEERKQFLESNRVKVNARYAKQKHVINKRKRKRYRTDPVSGLGGVPKVDGEQIIC